jgi:hypothetical protein
MATAVTVRAAGFSAHELRRLAAASRHANQRMIEGVDRRCGVPRAAPGDQPYCYFVGGGGERSCNKDSPSVTQAKPQGRWEAAQQLRVEARVIAKVVHGNGILTAPPSA